MTCVLGFVPAPSVSLGKEIIFCSDSCISIDDFTETISTPKIFIRDGLMIGFAGGYKEIQQIQHTRFDIDYDDLETQNLSDMAFVHNLLTSFVPAAISNNPLHTGFGGPGTPGDEIANVGVHLIVGYKGILYLITADLVVLQVNTKYTETEIFKAIGSGGLVATAAYNTYAKCDISNMSIEERLTNIMEVAAEMHSSVALPLAIVSQQYDPDTKKTTYVVSETHGPVDVSISSNYPNPVEVIYLEDKFSGEDLTFIPVLPAPKKNKKKKKGEDNAEV